MASPWNPPQRSPDERQWMGMAMLVAVPLLSLILIRMLWSGSGLWFLAFGIILIGLAAVLFLARRPLEQEYARQTLAPESNRLPIVLVGVGALFLALLLLPNFASGGGGNSPIGEKDSSSNSSSSQVAGSVQPIVQPTAIATRPVAQVPSTSSTTGQSNSSTTSQQPSTTTDDEPSTSDSSDTVTGGETYIVQDGDTLWDIAATFGVTVDAIIEANGLDSPDDLELGQELTIPPATEDTTTGDSTEEAAEDEAE